MAGFIIFRDEESLGHAWSSANWVFRSFLQSVMSEASEDTELVYELTVSQAHQIVQLQQLAEENSPLFGRTVTAFIRMCKLIDRGERVAVHNGDPLDSESQLQYRQSISELASMLDEFAKEQIHKGG